ncbi:MAG TPA: HlyD family efflux transporter periplasmic adaptor subunit [Bryobacteraceae bacterium]|jgi:membrane fusion protein (multidrug efflux system)|nr:HlyD family efflux transporter periplasmic adaptor subunit [Bryobacteraceae bacterium]
MAITFGRVNEALRIDNGLKSGAVLAGALLLLGAWSVWAFRARVTRYEISDTARLELNGAAYPLQANVAGELVASHLNLGRQVEAGEILLELDSEGQLLSLAEQRTRLRSLQPQIAALRAQMKVDGGGSSDEKRALWFSRQVAGEQYTQAVIEASQARTEADRAAHLRAEGIVSDAEAQKAASEAASRKAAADALRVAIDKLGPESAVRDRDRDVRLKQIGVEIARLEADATNATAAIYRLEEDVERRRIRAPISGRLGECAILRPGVHISEGQQLGVILPGGRLQVVAEFEPSAALGKVHPGQRAVVRLQGFPWAQFGVVPARVSHVAGDIRDGKVRVELAVLPQPHSRIPFQHGLPGTVEIEIEHLSPAALVLRSAGRALGAN